MPRVFISYRREDTEGAADRLYEHLASRLGAEHVFMDIDSIPLGGNFEDVIYDTLSASDVVLPLIGRRWLTVQDQQGRRRLDDPDDYHRREIEAALARRDVYVIPILYNGAEMPRPDDLPPSLASLSKRNALELSRTYFDAGIERLIRWIDRLSRAGLLESADHSADQVARGTSAGLPLHSDGARMRYEDFQVPGSKPKAWSGPESHAGRTSSQINCPRCASELAPWMQFCPGCGYGLLRSCASCDQNFWVWMTYCPMCGARAGEQPSMAEASADRAIQLTTVLFGDVKGFTAISEHLPPEEVTDIMNRCLEVLSEPIVRYGGTIDKYVGDAIMARFGAPRAHGDDPVRAIHAALEMQGALVRFTEKLKMERGFELQMRVGINTGQVLATQVGTGASKHFTLMGNTVNLASRLEHAAEPGSVLVGEATYRLAKHAFVFDARPPMQIRGQAEPINAFVPLRPRADTSSPSVEKS